MDGEGEGGVKGEILGREDLGGEKVEGRSSEGLKKFEYRAERRD